MAPQHEMCVGPNKGHKVTKLPKTERPARRRGVSLVTLLLTVRNKHLLSGTVPYYLATQQASEVRPRPCKGGLWSSTIREASNRVAQDSEG